MAAKTSSDEVNPSGVIRICKDCKIPFSDIYAYTDHLESKQHIKGVMKKKYAEKYLAAKAKLDEKNSEGEGETSFEMLNASQEKIKKPAKEMSKAAEKPVESSVTSSGKDSFSSNEDSDEDEVYTCKECKKVCTGLTTYKLHLEGKKHQKNMKKIKILQEMREQNMIPVLNDEPKEETLFDRLFPESRHVSSNMECKVCKKKNLGPEAYKQHCKSESHQKKVAMEELLKDMGTEGLSPAKDQGENNAFTKCDICNKAFSGPMPYLQHIKSLAHLKQEMCLQELGKIKDLIVSKEEDSKFKCKECGKMFSGPVPFNDHLKSSTHGKMKKKSDLTDQLVKEHPQLIKTVPAENSNGCQEDDNIMFGCKVCHMVFSGPEAANDHVTSSKHKKALKKKAMFKMLKQQQKAGKLLVTSDGAKAKKSESDDSSDFEKEFDILPNS